MKVLYTGSFNPFHNGHQYVFDVACKCFGKENVWIGVGVNPEKKLSVFTTIEYSIRPITRNIITYDCLTADVVKREKFDLIVRGVRPGRSLDDENDLLYWNRKLCGVETILIPTPPEVNQISSGAIRTLSSYKQDVSELVNPFVYARWTTPPKRTIYFGKCCSGKSTYIRNPYARRFDQLVWENLGKVDVENAKKQLKEAFYSNNKDIFDFFVDIIGTNADWRKMFNGSDVIDFPNLGTYWKYIPESILHTSFFVKLSASMEDRKFFAKQRKANSRLIKQSDKFYIDPPFWDEDIIIKRED